MTEEKEPLTAVERNYIEHWSRRRWQLLRSWLVTGSIMWGGLMSFFCLHEPYSEGRISSLALAIFIALFLFGGCVFGAGMWALGEFRYRRMVVQSKRVARWPSRD